MRKSITYIISNVDKAIAFEWIVEYLEHPEITLEFIILGSKKGHLYHWLESKQIPVQFYLYQGKRSMLKCFFQVWWKLLKSRTSIVHTHLFDANLIGLSAAWLNGIKRRIYTRHHSTFHHEYFPQAVKYDKLSNFLATDIIAISSNVKEVLVDIEKVEEKKITTIEHCFRLSQFQNVPKEKVKALREKYQILDNKKVIATISRYVKLKGIDFVIEAFKGIHKKFPNTHLLLANSGGSYETVIRDKLNELPEGSYTEIKFEPDLFALYQLIDIYCHVPINSRIEAFGQTYIEALASKTPSVFTLSGIAKDFIVDRNNALVVEPENTEQIAEAIEELLENNELSNKLISNGLDSVKRFELHNMISNLKHLYLS